MYKTLTFAEPQQYNRPFSTGQLSAFIIQTNSNNSAPSIRYCYSRGWTLLVIKTHQLLSERESQSAMIICRVCARRFFQFPVMFTINKKWRSTSWLTMFNSSRSKSVTYLHSSDIVYKKHYFVLLVGWKWPKVHVHLYCSIWGEKNIHFTNRWIFYIEQWRVFSTVGSFRPPPYILSL